MSQRKPPKEKINYILNLFESNQIQQALDLIDSLSKNYPDNSLLLNIRGACYADLGQLDIAAQSYKKALSIKPDYAKAHYNLGGVLQELDKLGDSVKSYRSAIKFEPKNAQAHNNLAIVLRELNQLEEAEISCRKAIALNPEYAEALCCLGIINYSNGDLDSAIGHMKKANAIDPNLKIIKLLLAVLESRKIHKNSEVSYSNKNNQDYVVDLPSNPLILNRDVEHELIDKLYQIKSLELNKTKDPSYGNARGSGYQLFQDEDSAIIKTVEDDIVKIVTKAIKADIHIKDSFFTILGSGGGVNRHNHISALDLDSSLNLAQQKFSLVYYLSIGDQDCREPGILKLYDPSENILPHNGMIIIFPSDRNHSVIYNRKKDRVIIGINFYSL